MVPSSGTRGRRSPLEESRVGVFGSAISVPGRRRRRHAGAAPLGLAGGPSRKPPSGCRKGAVARLLCSEEPRRQAERGRILPGPRGQGLVRSQMPPSVRRALGRETPRGPLPTSRSCPGPRPYGRGRRGSGLTLRCPRHPPPWGPVHILPLPSALPESPRRTLLWRRVWPPNRPQSSGPSSQGRGISWPLPEACRALAGGEKDTLHCPADPRTPARAFRFPGCFRPPSAHSVSPRRRTSGAVPALSPLGRHSRAFRVC